MKIKELKRMNRAELLELLIAQMEENERLEARLDEAEAQLQNRQLVMDHAGSIAEAALALNGVFEAAEAAAQQYLESVRNQEAAKIQSYDGRGGCLLGFYFQKSPFPAAGG